MIFVACTLGCATCVDKTGECINCQSDYLPDPNDNTKCNAKVSKLPVGGCPIGSYYDSNDGNCTKCDPVCYTCYDKGSGQCDICAPGRSKKGLICVPTDENGNCVGTDEMMVADNNRHQCEGEDLKKIKILTHEGRILNFSLRLWGGS